MRTGSGRGWRRLRTVAGVIATPLLILVFLLSLPILLPVVGWQMARANRRKAALAGHWPCARCGVPLGQAALDRADAVFEAHAAALFAENAGIRRRIVRDLDACCTACGAGHRFVAKEARFAPLDEGAFARRYGPFVRLTVPRPHPAVTRT